MYYMVRVLTEREKEIINKRIKEISLTQNESNILSRFIRPKLREISQINSNMLLSKMEYNQKAISIENKIKKTELENIQALAPIQFHP